jgi:hypothetical protein
MKAIPISSATATTNAKINAVLPFELDSVEDVPTVLVAAGAVCVAVVGADDLGVPVVP